MCTLQLVLHDDIEQNAGVVGKKNDHGGRIIGDKWTTDGLGYSLPAVI